MQSPTILTEAECTVHPLKINGYSVTKALSGSDYISSGRLAAGGYDWEVRYYPSYFDYEHDEFWIAFRLVFCSKGCTNGVKAALKCRLLNETPYREPFGSKTVSCKYKSQKDCGPTLLLVKQEDFSGSEYLRGDSFVVECTITVLREPREAGTNVHPSFADPCCDLHLHLGELLLSQKGADITLVVSGESFLAHKSILAARSPVFMAEFFGPMKESSSECVEIKDMAAPVFKAMLNFIYTGTLPELDQHGVSDMEQGVATMAHHLLVAADRYGLDRLKLICENKLSNGLNVETVATTLAFAEQHNCSQLKARCIDVIISSAANLDAVMATEGYKLIMASCPSVLNALLRTALGRQK